MASAAAALKPDGWFVVMLEGDDPDRLLAAATAGAAADLELVDVIHRESRRSGDGVTLHFRKPSAEDRLRDAVQARPLRLGADEGHLTYPELAEAIDQAAVALLRARGEPAGLTRIAAAVVLHLQRSGLLRRVASGRSGGDDDDEVVPDARLERGGAALLATLLREELWRDDHRSLVRLGDAEDPQWWLRDPELAESPLADRVEWSTFSILSTAGRLDEQAFLERIYALFPGLDSPDEELVRACLAAYAASGERGQLRTDEELSRRLEEHARVIGLLVDYAHRLGLKAWVSRREHDRPYEGSTLLDRLQDDERRAYLPLVIRAPAEVLGTVDALWYRRGRLAFLFEVEWTAMMGEAILRRGRQIPSGDQQARFLVFPAERTELVRPEARAIALAACRGGAAELALPEVAAPGDAGGVGDRRTRAAGARAGAGSAHRTGRPAAHHVRGVGGRSSAGRASDRWPLTESVCSAPGVPWFPPAALPSCPSGPASGRFRAPAPARRAAHRAPHHGHHLIDVRLPLPALDGV